MSSSAWVDVAAVTLIGVLAVLAGSPLTTWVFRRVDRPGLAGRGVRGMLAAEVVLKGGRTIGLLERAAVYLCVAAGWPEGIAVVVALKGLGRFAELRGSTEGTAERFLIGSFASLVFAGALGGLARLVMWWT